ncbi:pseudoazurin [Cereibacter ovatus]|uniref:Pseudoazurin n=1 Tax=Cereibacter ovatus TaxID=439529 RepID=A0A285CWJ0_9RHOB|nr:pseudoazurin [Cereibacter ovatus]SNX71910.1 pseudoazurin [Cereibacter ovatus]
MLAKFPMIGLAAGLAAALVAPAAHATNHEIAMVNIGSSGAKAFEPAFIEAKVGDTVTFIPVDKGFNAEVIPGMLPLGARGFKGEMNRPVTVTLTQEGVWGVKSMPYFGMGMVALIQVGTPVNLQDALSVPLPARAQARMEPMLAQAMQNYQAN